MQQPVKRRTKTAICTHKFHFHIKVAIGITAPKVGITQDKLRQVSHHTIFLEQQTTVMEFCMDILY
jgi:hypothetical protein